MNRIVKHLAPASSAAALSPDGSLLGVAGLEENRIHLWDRRRKRVFRVLEALPDGVRALAFSRDGKFLLSFGPDGTVWLWDPIFGEEVGSLG